MGDISAGPDLFVRFLASNYDSDNVDVGEEPKSWAEVASEKFKEARLEARKRVTRGKGKAVKIVHVLTITETVTPGNGDVARLEEPSFEFTTKMSKAPPIKGAAAWIDNEGNQIGKVEKNLTLAAVDGGKSIAAAKAEQKRRSAS